MNKNYGNPVLFLDKKIKHMQNFIILIRSSQCNQIRQDGQLFKCFYWIEWVFENLARFKDKD